MIFAALAALAALVAMPSRGEEARANRADAIAVSTQVLAIEAEQVNIGELRHVAAVVLMSEDARFGGFSGLSLVDGRELTAISDRGHWWTASLEHDASGRLRGVRGNKMGPLLDTDGGPVTGRARRDAEELLRLPDGSWLVSFEGDHRLWRYGVEAGGANPPIGRPEEVAVPVGLAAAGDNAGLEAMARLGANRMLLLTEGMHTQKEGTIRGWVGPTNGQAWQAMALTPTGSFKPTGAAALPNGDVLLVERSFDIVAGVRIRISVLQREQLVADAVVTSRKLAYLLPQHHIDNLEAIAVDVRDDGTYVIYLLSDDNFRSQQRTVLLQLTWQLE